MRRRLREPNPPHNARFSIQRTQRGEMLAGVSVIAMARSLPPATNLILRLTNASGPDERSIAQRVTTRDRSGLGQQSGE